MRDLAISTLCSGTSHVVPPRRAAPPDEASKNGGTTHLKRSFNDNGAYYKLVIIARLSKFTKVKVPDEDVVELGRKITVLSPYSLYRFPPQLLTASIFHLRLG